MKNSEIKKFLVELKGGKCEICGYHTCLWALEFHHKDPNAKEFSINDIKIGRKKFSLRDIVLETDKCQLVCANCHREIHHHIPTQRNTNLQNHQTKLSPMEVKQIRKLLKENKTSQYEIAKNFKVSETTISQIKTGKRWSTVV